MRWLVFLFCFNTSWAAPTIRIQLGGEPSTLDPARVIDQYAFGILRNVVEGLFKIDATGARQNALAQSYSISKDQRVYRFRLDPLAKWSDGRPVTIDDFIFGLQHAVDPRTASPNVDALFAIGHAEEIFHGKRPAQDLAVRRQGEELVIQLDRPDPAFLMELTLPLAGPLRRDVFEAHGGQWDYRFPVTGDYQITTYKPADQIALTPNPYKAQPAVHPVVYKILSEEISAMNLFESGYLDVISTMTATEQERFKDVLFLAPSTTVFYFAFNMSRAPFSSLEWRQAIASSMDREGLVQALHGLYEPSVSYLPKLGGRELAFPSAVRKVRALPSKPRLTLSYGASAFTRVVAEKFQHDLKSNLDVDVNLQPMELKTLLARLQSDPPDMYFLGMSALYDDPMNQLNAFVAQEKPNFSRYKSAAYNAVIAKIRRTPYGGERSKLARQANDLLVAKDVAVVPMVLRLQAFAVSRGLKGFNVNPYQMIELRRLAK